MGQAIEVFAVRISKHTSYSHCGFSLFEVIYGRAVQRPLEVLKEGWLSGDVKKASAVDWINELKEKLCLISEISSENDRKSKAAMNSFKKWVNVEAQVLRVVMAQEKEEDDIHAAVINSKKR